MPNRIIKESIRSSKSINALTDFQFRVWVHLITYVDDYGRGSADAELIKGFVFPRLKRVRESDIDGALAALADIGAIHLYQVDGEALFCFPNWGEHQRIQTKKSKFPPPPCSTVSHRESPPESNPKPNPNPESEKRAGARRFVPPSLDEVSAYCRERNNGVDAEAFIAFYASKGWKVGHQPMKDWKQAVITWEKRRKDESEKGSGNPFLDYARQLEESAGDFT